MPDVPPTSERSKRIDADFAIICPECGQETADGIDFDQHVKREHGYDRERAVQAAVDAERRDDRA